MPNEKQTIRTLTEPTIILDDLQFLDTEAGTSTTLGKPQTAVSLSAQHGGVSPLMQINDYKISSEQIASMRISASGDRPTISVQILVTDKSFYSTSYPKDGDLLSVFIRGKVEPLKPIRNDYEITSVYVDSPLGSGENDQDTMYISGVLRVPGYDALKCFSVKDTSFKALMKVATDLKLGFATNEVNTTDKQSWICPYEKVKDFIRETTTSAWKDDNSFFNSFIDHYYYLNFVNVEPFYSDLPDFEKAVAILRDSHDYGKDSELYKSEFQVILSNWDDISHTQFYLTSHALINNSSSINMQHGYKRYVQYYDGLLKSPQTFFVDPKTTPGAEKDKQLLRGRPKEDFYKQQINGKWMGVQYGKDGENCHPKFNYARVNNFQNNAHIEKMGLKVVLANPNFNLRRMQVVPVVIIIKKDIVRKKLNEPSETNSSNATEPNREEPAVSHQDSPFLIDRTISGYYTLHDIEYVYEQGGFRQECTLYRREWPTPPQI